MSNHTIDNYDRRSAPRTLINGAIKFKCSSDNDFSRALIVDISETGVLIGLDHRISNDQEIMLMLEAKDQYEGQIEIAAKVVRLAKSLGDDCYTYGCEIHTISGFE